MMRQGEANGLVLGIRGFDNGVPDPVPPPNPPTDDHAREALEAARYEADAAKAELLKLRQAMDKLQKELPSDEQRVKFQELLAKEQKAEEDRLKAEGEFDKWRQQINEKHEREMNEEKQKSLNAKAAAEANERELNDTYIELAFSAATEWFGPAGKTVMMPDMAKSYFAHNVEVEVIAGANGAPGKRRVVVKGENGAVIVDPKSGKPMAFSDAIGEVIQNHPSKAYLLRGSGKHGSGSPGGTSGGSDIDLSRLKSRDFERPEVREAVRAQQQQPGGMQIGPGFEKFRRPAK
jgi:hypothetical protein